MGRCVSVCLCVCVWGGAGGGGTSNPFLIGKITQNNESISGVVTR